MRFYVNNDQQLIVGQLLLGFPPESIALPRAGNVPIEVQFTSDGVIYDPEVLTASIASHTAALATVITTAAAHGFSDGDTVVISGVTGTPISITASNPLAPLAATMTSASPCVITTATHNLAVGQIVIFGTTGSLYSGLQSGIPYFVSAVPSPTTFRVSATLNGADLNTSGSQSGSHYVSLPFTTATTSSIHGLSTGDTATIADSPSVADVSVNITTSSEASPSIITVPSGHSLQAGDLITITGHTGNPSTILSVGTDGTTPIVTTSTDHGLVTGDVVAISGVTGYTATPDVNGSQTITVTGTRTFTLTAINVTVAGSGGTVTRATSTPTLNGLWVATPINNTQFHIGVAVTHAGVGGIMSRAGSDINGIGTVRAISSTVLQITSRSATVTYGGTVSGESSVPTINGSHGIALIDQMSFSIAVNVSVPGVGGIVTRTVPLDLRWTVKAAGEFDEDPSLATIAPGDFIKVGSGSSTVFKGYCNYITAALNGLLGIEAPVGPNTLTSISNATPCVVTMAAPQSFTTGDIVTFSTTGTLPSPLVAGQEYYITVLTASTFNIALTATGAAINTSSAGSGIHSYIRFKSSNDIEQVKAMAELSWGGSNPGKTNWVTHYIRNDLYKVGETAPVSTIGAAGKKAIGNGDSSVTVTFSVALASANWHFLGSPTISNTIDIDPRNLITSTLTARSAAGFTIQLTGATDTDNYKMEYVIVLD